MHQTLSGFRVLRRARTGVARADLVELGDVVQHQVAVRLDHEVDGPVRRVQVLPLADTMAACP